MKKWRALVVDSDLDYLDRAKKILDVVHDTITVNERQLAIEQVKETPEINFILIGSLTPRNDVIGLKEELQKYSDALIIVLDTFHKEIGDPYKYMEVCMKLTNFKMQVLGFLGDYVIGQKILDEGFKVFNSNSNIAIKFLDNFNK